MTETFTLWARTAQENHETMTTERFGFNSPVYRDHALAYLRKRGERGVRERGWVAFSIRDLSGMIVHEQWARSKCAPEWLCQNLLAGLSPDKALAWAQSQDTKSPYWAKVRELLETFAVRAAKK